MCVFFLGPKLAMLLDLIFGTKNWVQSPLSLLALSAKGDGTWGSSKSSKRLDIANLG